MKNFKDKQKWGEKFNSIYIHHPASTTAKSWPGLFLLYLIYPSVYPMDILKHIPNITLLLNILICVFKR